MLYTLSKYINLLLLLCLLFCCCCCEFHENRAGYVYLFIPENVCIIISVLYSLLYCPLCVATKKSQNIVHQE